MAIIDPEGLFCGERLASCSDMAQLYWPRFFLAANSCARLELSYKSIVSRVFGNFQKIPSSSEIWEIFREYEANFLAVLYETESGSWWCQFSTSEKYLPKYKKTRDNLSPSPSCEQMDAYRYGYLQWKRSKSIKNQSFQKISEDFQGEGVGIGIGVGEGIGKKPSRGKRESKHPLTKTAIKDARHTLFKSAIFAWWAFANGEGTEPPWNGAEGSQLSMLLEAAPKMTEEAFKRMLHNRGKSGDAILTARPSLWLGKITNYEKKPLNQFSRSPDLNGYSEKGAKLQEFLAKGHNDEAEPTAGNFWSTE